MVFKGPVRPGTSEATFRATGVSVPRRSGGRGGFAGPVRPKTDEAIFRATGKSVPVGSSQATAIRSQLLAEATKQKAIEQQVERARQAEAERARQQTLDRARADAIAQNLSTFETQRFVSQQAERFRKEEERKRRESEEKIKKIGSDGRFESLKRVLLFEEKKFAESNIGKIFNVISGGTFSRRKLDRDQQKLFGDIDKFNKRFGDRELSQFEFNFAKKISDDLTKRQNDIIEDKEDIVQEFKKGVKGFFFGTPLRSTKADRDRGINKLEGFITSDLKTLQKEGISKSRKKRLKLQIKNREKEILRLEGGWEVILGRLQTGTVPLGFAPGVFIPKNVEVAFLGAPKVKGNKIITDIVFKVGGKKVGTARGVTILKGSGGKTFTVGGLGKQTFKLPSGQSVIIKKQTFSGIEKAATKPFEFPVGQVIEIGGKQFKIITGNIKGIQQAGVGRVISAKGDKLFKGGKAVKGLTAADFSSLSAFVTEKDLSLIIGKTITTTGNRAKFIGLLKGTTNIDSIGKLTSVQKSQYQVALKKVVSAMASAADKSIKIKGLTKAQKLSATAFFLKQSTRKLPPVKLKPVVTTKVEPTPIIKAGVKLTPKQIQKTKTRVKQGLSQLSNEQQKKKQRLRQITKAEQKTTTK